MWNKFLMNVKNLDSILSYRGYCNDCQKTPETAFGDGFKCIHENDKLVKCPRWSCEYLAVDRLTMRKHLFWEHLIFEIYTVQYCQNCGDGPFTSIATNTCQTCNGTLTWKCKGIGCDQTLLDIIRIKHHIYSKNNGWRDILTFHFPELSDTRIQNMYVTESTNNQPIEDQLNLNNNIQNNSIEESALNQGYTNTGHYNNFSHQNPTSATDEQPKDEFDFNNNIQINSIEPSNLIQNNPAQQNNFCEHHLPQHQNPVITTANSYSEQHSMTHTDSISLTNASYSLPTNFHSNLPIQRYNLPESAPHIPLTPQVHHWHPHMPTHIPHYPIPTPQHAVAPFIISPIPIHYRIGMPFPRHSTSIPHPTTAPYVPLTRQIQPLHLPISISPAATEYNYLPRQYQR